MSQAEVWILDGWLGSPWRLQPLARHLNRAGLPCRLWDYDSSGRSSFQSLATDLAFALKDGTAPIRLVGFSMGGIVIRTALLEHPQLPVHRAVFLNSPHQGTLWAHLGYHPALRDLRPNTPFLQALNRQPLPIPHLNVWCPGDTVVVPSHRSRLPGATRERLCLPPIHPWPLLSPNLHREVASFLQTENAAFS
ncbi:MAG: alpha/beta hydrolase [Blastochloris sp.]|nr:alpha/beta hydrolase [Blastochloris sp.]